MQTRTGTHVLKPQQKHPCHHATRQDRHTLPGVCSIYLFLQGLQHALHLRQIQHLARQCGLFKTCHHRLHFGQSGDEAVAEVSGLQAAPRVEPHFVRQQGRCLGVTFILIFVISALFDQTVRQAVRVLINRLLPVDSYVTVAFVYKRYCYVITLGYEAEL